jgi:hypothetical protein
MQATPVALDQELEVMATPTKITENFLIEMSCWQQLPRPLRNLV